MGNVNFDFEMQPGMKVFNRDVVKDENPLVSIVTPFYNGGKYIRQTYNCVINQTFPWFEWIIVDDGSTEESDVKLLEELSSTDSRITVVHKQNGGISSARNYGIKKAKADLFIPLDCDDLIEPPFLEYCWWMMQKNKDAAWAYTDSVGFQNQEYIWKKNFDPILLKTENHLTATSCIRKRVYEEIDGYSEVAKHYNEDWYFYLRLVAKGCFPVQAKNDLLFWYRRRDDGVLSIVDDLNKKNALNQKLIADMAQNVIEPNSPIIFPENSYNYEPPKISEVNRKVFKHHSKIHVLLITGWLEMGGADKFNLDLIKGLNKDKFEVGIITTWPNDTEPWQQLFREAIPDVFNLPNFMHQKDYAEFISYYIKTREVDVLMVTNSFHAYYLLPWLRLNFPRLSIVDYVHMEEWYFRNGGFARLSAVLNNVIEKTFVCNSETKRVIEKDFSEKRNNVSVVHIGVDPIKFNPEYIAKGIVRKKYGIASDRPLVLFICRFHPQKRPFLMLEIARKTKEKMPSVAFLAVGDGPLRKQMEEKVSYMGLRNTVIFTGAHVEVRPFYKDADLTLICSVKEGLTLTAYESCAMGVPVISADVGGQKDLIDDSIGALIRCRQSENTLDEQIDDEEVEEYSSVILRYLNNKKALEKASIRARMRILEGFTIQNMVKKIEKEFENLTKDNRYFELRNKKSEELSDYRSIVEDYYVMELISERVQIPPTELLDKEYRDETNMLNRLDEEVLRLNHRVDSVECSISDLEGKIDYRNNHSQKRKGIKRSLQDNHYQTYIFLRKTKGMLMGKGFRVVGEI